MGFVAISNSLQIRKFMEQEAFWNRASNKQKIGMGLLGLKCSRFINIAKQVSSDFGGTSDN